MRSRELARGGRQGFRDRLTRRLRELTVNPLKDPIGVRIARILAVGHDFLLLIRDLEVVVWAEIVIIFRVGNVWNVLV